MKSPSWIASRVVIPFTSLDESELCDSEVTVVGQQMFLHFYEKDRDMKSFLSRVLTTIPKGITIILFKSDSDRVAFQSVINSPSIAPLILKMEADGGSLLFHMFEEFEKMLIEFKSM